MQSVLGFDYYEWQGHVAATACTRSVSALSRISAFTSMSRQTRSRLAAASGTGSVHGASSNAELWLDPLLRGLPASSVIHVPTVHRHRPAGRPVAGAMMFSVTVRCTAS